jgi:DNA-binding LytR/AlgR family response regulator
MEKITIRNENEMHIIHVGNLLAVTVEDYLCTFFIENEPPFSCTKSLKEALASLPDFFIRINRNCAVNMNKIKSIDLRNKKVQIQRDLFFPFSTRNAKGLKEHFQNKSTNTKQI